jgi:hypothetical protein
MSNKDLNHQLKKRLSVVLPEIKHREIKLAAATLGVSMKKFIDLSVEMYIKTLKQSGK